MGDPRALQEVNHRESHIPITIIEFPDKKWNPQTVKILAGLLLAVVIASPIGFNLAKLPLSLSWNQKNVGGWVSPEMSMAVDENGSVHIACCDGGGLEYWTNAEGRWTHHSFGFFTRFVSIAVDADGASHIAATAFGSNGRELVYLTDSSGAWISTHVDSTLMGWPLSIAVDSNSIPHITYPTGTDSWVNGKLMYATIENGTWTTQEIPYDHSEAWSTDIAVDSQGHVHIVGSMGSILYITNSNGSWTRELVFGNDLSQDSVSIALDSNDSPRIAYFGGNSLEGKWGLQYAVRTNGHWSSTTVEALGTYMYPSCSIAIDKSDTAHIVYTDLGKGELEYATIAGGAQTNLTIDHSIAGGETACSVGTDGDGDVHICYAAGSGAVVYITDQPPPMIYRMILGAAEFKAILCAPILVGYFLWLRNSRKPHLDSQDKDDPNGYWSS